MAPSAVRVLLHAWVQCAGEPRQMISHHVIHVLLIIVISLRVMGPWVRSPDHVMDLLDPARIQEIRIFGILRGSKGSLEIHENEGSI
jgi:hypothetical protein